MSGGYQPKPGGVLGSPPTGGSGAKLPPFPTLRLEAGETLEQIFKDMNLIRATQTADQSDSKQVYPDGNPKTLAGSKKPDLSVVPPPALLHLATAMMNGADKYGPFNWREQPISVRPYLAAAGRHLGAYLDGEEFSADTEETGVPVHHLAHVMACCAILLDAMETGNLNDNRPVRGRAGAMVEEYNRNKRFGLT